MRVGFLNRYGRVSEVLERRNKIRNCKVALHIISATTIGVGTTFVLVVHLLPGPDKRRVWKPSIVLS
jgi:hypothetical protein